MSVAGDGGDGTFGDQLFHVHSVTKGALGIKCGGVHLQIRAAAAPIVNLIILTAKRKITLYV